ncbi:MAG: DJ-1/PfpI family protein [Paludibacteraceae bacterium]|nr:DJ-1/PfpI family protein [Paludibacteraceae bacterium]
MNTYVFLANGFEDIEAVATIDILRRANFKVITVSISRSLDVESAHGIVMRADVLIDSISVSSDDLLILPGGMPGTTNLGKCSKLTDILVRHNEAHGWIAAICAAPSVLGQLGILKGHIATCYPGFEQYLDCKYDNVSRVVVSDNIITSCGPGQAMNFALAIVSKVSGNNSLMESVRDAMQF